MLCFHSVSSCRGYVVSQVFIQLLGHLKIRKRKLKQDYFPSFSLSDHCFLRSCPSQGDLQRPLPKKCHHYCRCKEAEKQGSREGPKLLSAAWKEHRSPPLPSIWAPGKIATWGNRTREIKHIEDEIYQTLECSTKQNGSH